MSQSSYPGLIDSDVELPRVEDNITDMGGEAINSLRDAVFAIETAIGLNPQGNTEDLVTRINVSIDSDGLIKQSALSERGLVTLPIVNSHIGDNAAILESKLDLDYTTTYLNGKIVSNITDIDTLRLALNGWAAITTGHFTGTSNRHDGYHIDLTQPIRSSSDLETIINVLNNAFTAHEQSTTGAHTAYGISVNDEFVNISADNVQDALLRLDRLGSGATIEHQDRLHSNAVSQNQRGEQGLQGNLRETTLAGTIYQTEVTKATNIFQVMRPNVARVTSGNIDLRALSVGVSIVLRVQAGGVDRAPIDVNFSAVVPTDDLDEIVRAFNTKCQGCDDHYPLSAYNTGGKLTIAHNMLGKEFTVQILDTVQFSASTALGFQNVAGTEFEWSGDSNAGYAGGTQITDLKSLVKKYHTHSTKPYSNISLGLGDLAEYGLTVGSEGRVLCNITNHSSSPTDNGTHYILGFTNDETFVLSSDIQLGSFDIEIVADAVNFENSANGELYDIFVEADYDGYGIVTKYNRASYGPIAGVDLRSISEDFPTDNMEWEIVDSNSLRLLENSEEGTTTAIPTGFQGQLKVMAPDNINSALFEVTGVPSNTRKDITVYTFSGTDDRLHIATVHYSGNNGLTSLKHVSDRRLMGGSVENKTEDALSPTLIEDTTKELRNNGIIRGFTVISYDTTTFELKGGRALVDGRLVDVETKTVTVDDLGAEQKLLVVDRHGNYFVKSEFDSGYSFADMTAGDGYGDDRGFAIICEFETNGTTIEGNFIDRRLMVNKLDKRLLNTVESLENKITQLQDSSSGSAWGLTIVESSIVSDGYLANIEPGLNYGFEQIDARGFGADSAVITTRRFEFSDPDCMKTSVFRPSGMSHINVFVEATYTGATDGVGGPFGVSGTVHVELGVSVERGMTGFTTADEYARVKTIYTGVLPADSQTERYVASIPVSELGLPENVMFDVVPRVRILNSNYVDGGPSSDLLPTIRFDHVRIVTSSYSIAGEINEEDGSSAPVGAVVGEIL